MNPTLTSLKQYGSLIKFSHTLFALPFAGIAFVLAFLKTYGKSVLDWTILSILILLSMVFARSAAMGFNRIVDTDIDAKNERTEKREIPAGKISKRSAISFVVLSSLGFFITSWFINSVAWRLSFPTLMILLGYSLSKRFTWLCHFILGFSIGLAPLATWVAIREEIVLEPILWTVGLAFNLAGFDILYALQDREFDRKEGLHSIPARFGRKHSFLIAIVSHILCIFFLFTAGIVSQLGPVFLIFLVFIGYLLFQEHRIARASEENFFPPKFYQIHSYISLILFAGLLIDRILFLGILID
ncbi:4-hydroxybenzoate octaprenyltransferase [Leptospira santarosai]|uniref:4-hydroxybenzoate polyprenyltransferase n=4 Tax=Leptospira santarosai TaxID=28183 RepID=M6V500_9LEPT|nr:4-hydroxybenzoate octaprenyltransferase [Leptospira santarosai]EMO56557.1 putative 4-hydroxybenzoate polyprenyltransferase [Leptospira santarosai str. CBC1416]AVV49382.1 Putative 4-hydroxybenzoate polyprenyltransferase [Leptospira santarosai]AVV80417.1 Putative 4-hydroxybenzoate polyprenyltransferase [Leptospira santarosai]EKO31809.1 putative 4-hydroxybenzoate polyprenyltransferase [Leptospira santarosai str. MOR084]EMF90368.1 putative 4-hydroxybenzoate polyprenyltransferase [Leptospira san